MSPAVAAGIIVAASIVAWALFMAYLSAGRPKPEATAPAVGAPAVGAPAVGAPAPEAAPGPAPRPPARRFKEDPGEVTRRQFLNRAFFGSFMIGMLNFSLASLDFLWPRLRGGFGAKITVNVPGVGDDAEAIKNFLSSSRTPTFISDGRFYVMTFEGDPRKAASVPAYKLANTAESGIVALYRKCVHLGCSVPWCSPSKWFECPCHGSKYSINGEYRDGPAPRSMDRFRVEIVNGKAIVDTSQTIQMPRGVVTSQPQPEGEHCVEVREG